MKWGEIGVLLLIASGAVGLAVVLTMGAGAESLEESMEPADPLELLEEDLVRLMYGPGFRTVPAAPPDTLVRAMDLKDDIPLCQANLFITRSLRSRGFDHGFTVGGDNGLTFVGTTPSGEPFRLELKRGRL